MIGVAFTEINPPVGMYARTWGNSEHDIADGIHRSLRASCFAIADSLDANPMFFITLDLMVWLSKEDEEGIRGPIEAELGIEPGRLILQLSHSHGAPFTDPGLANSPGGGLIERYRAEIVTACLMIAAEAQATMSLATLSWGVGKCGLAYNRDLVLPETGEIICGVNPLKVADDTLVVGRVTDLSGTTTATLVHYAAHPTSLGGGNRLISPDYVGAMRELIERETSGAVCIFLHGADGELTPRRSFENNVEAADQNGQELGYAALSILTGMFRPGERMVFDKRVESGATLGLWKLEKQKPDYSLDSKSGTVKLEVGTLLPITQCRAEIENATTGFEKERAQRRLAMREKVGEAEEYELPIYVWRLGKSFFVGAPVEFYSDVQISLRESFPEFTVVVLDVCNGFLNYLPSEFDFDRDTYPVRISLFAAGSMERARNKAAEIISAMV
jgi:hypothetical protein